MLDDQKACVRGTQSCKHMQLRMLGEDLGLGFGIRALAAAWICSVVFPGAALSDVGEAVSVIQPARLKSGTVTATLHEGRQVLVGDIVATGDGGRVELVFQDETRIVVGPNSQLTVRQMLFRNNGKAKRFGIDAVSGTFRVLTGNSPKRAYRFRTPTATMAVRGTQFDFAYDRTTRDSAAVVHDGLILMCASRTRCTEIPAGCNVVYINAEQNFSQPLTRGELAETLQHLFPYATDDSQLGGAFQAPIGKCREAIAFVSEEEDEEVIQLVLPFDLGTAPLPPQSSEKPVEHTIPSGAGHGVPDKPVDPKDPTLK